MDFAYHKPDHYKSTCWTAGRFNIKNAWSLGNTMQKNPELQVFCIIILVLIITLQIPYFTFFWPQKVYSN